METTKEEPATFTPGPWEYSTTYMGKSEVYIGPDEKTGGHCVVYSKNHYKDARLIASAPEMYQLLCKISNSDLGDVETAIQITLDARELLAKVEGGEG